MSESLNTNEKEDLPDQSPLEFVATGEHLDEQMPADSSAQSHGVQTETENESHAEDDPHFPHQTLEGSSAFQTSDDQGNVEKASGFQESKEDTTEEKLRKIQLHDISNSTATVKVMLIPEGYMMTVAFTIGQTTWDLKQHFARELRVPPNIIQISLEGKNVEDNQTLMDLGVQPHGTVQLEMTSADPVRYPIRPVKPQQEYGMNDVITVRVQTDVDTFQDMVVEIVRAPQRKPFLGGYRHKLTGAEYRHAAVQTPPRRRPDRGIESFSRDTQTVETKSQAQQCTSDTSTQVTKIGCFVSNVEDKLVMPGTYITADECHSKRLRAVIKLQAHTRRWQARRLTQQLRGDKVLRLAWLEREEWRKKEEKEEQIRAEYHRRMNPENKQDFTLLYSALEKWRREELERINAALSGAERKAALCALLEQETQFIASIGRRRITAGERGQEKAVQDLLNKCAAPKTWRAFDGKRTQMDTQHTLRARELRDLYTGINRPDLQQDQRREWLLTLKHTVQEHDCKLTQDIVQLIDREADLMMRGVKGRKLEGLRRRISTLFLQYIKTPDFNPEVAKLLKVPQDPAQLRQNIFFCRGCSEYLPSASLALTATAPAVGLCRRCSGLDNEGRRREDFSHYRTILSHLRKAEAESHPEARIPYLLQEQDLRYLVEVVWGAQSALSAWADPHDLLLVRWERRSEWSPWNCVLLTKEEAVAHGRVEDVEKAYGLTFMRSIKHKHTLARKYFSQIPVMAEYLQEMDPLSAAPGNLLVSKAITTVSK